MSYALGMTQLERIMVGGNHLASALIGLTGGPPPSYRLSLEEARPLFKSSDVYDAWVCWRTIMLVRDELAGEWERPLS